jgi:hypothetical protein
LTKIDLKSGWNLVRIKEGKEWNTAFRNHYEYFEYLVMLIRLANGPAMVQDMMTEIRWDLINQGVVVYIDDILIYARTMEEHVLLVKEVLERLYIWNHAISIKKCRFHKDFVEFLGYIISKDNIAMSEDKVEAIRSWESPKTQSNIQSFIGFTNFYRQLIENLSKVVKLLTDLTNDKFKRNTFEWSDAAE